MIDRYSDFLRFREKYKTFKYKAYEYVINKDNIEISYEFEIEGLETFKPTWKLDIINENKDINLDKVESLVFSLGMVELVSYWKLTCSENIEIDCFNLNEEEITWWKKLYKKGLGEFYYLNNINPDLDYMTITCNSDKKLNVETEEQISKENVLVPVGGGKDSIVSLELLKNKFNVYPFIINPRGATTNSVKRSNLENKLLVAERKLDTKIVELNKKGFLNGHTPFSAMVAFSTVLVAYLNNLGYVALSNEASANESTVKGTEVNHQYSKSFEFEEDFTVYHNSFIKSPVNYFSFLRPLSEMQIAKLVAGFENYHDIFRSCNVGSKEDIWCSACPKCLFVYTMLAPYLAEEKMVKIFGKNLLDEENLMEDFQKLTGILEEKPFECVGEIDEVKSSLNIILHNYEKEGKKLPVLLSFFKENFKEETYVNFDKYYNEENNLPSKFADVIKNNEVLYEK